MSGPDAARPRPASCPRALVPGRAGRLLAVAAGGLAALALAALTPAAPPGPAPGAFQVAEDGPLDDPKRAEVAVEVSDGGAGGAAPRPLPVRVIVTASDGSHPDGSGHGVYADGRFFADGRFTVKVPPGRARVLLRSGPNHVPLELPVDARAGRRLRLRAALRRWFAPEERGWYGGDNHVHAQHDETAQVKTGLDYAALQARANGLAFITEAGSNVSYERVDRLDTPEFLLRYAPELRPGPFLGHRNTPGIRHPLPPERYERLVGRPLPTQALTEAVHELGGAVVYTHPLTPAHQLHWMGSPEALSDAVLGRCADAFDTDSRATELLWFALLNLGNRLAVSSYTDCALGRARTPSPGDRRVYCHAEELTYPALVRALRRGRTFATNGGPVFPFFTLDGHEPGDVLEAARGRARRARVEVRSLYPLRRAELVGRGNPVKAFAVAGRKGEVRLAHDLEDDGAGGWYAFRAEDDRGNWALTSPVYLESPRPRPRPPASALLLEISNHTRYVQLRRDFFAHLLVTVSPDDPLREAELLRDDEVVHAFRPADGNRSSGGQVPVTGAKGDYGPGWVWHRQGGAAVHLQADWPVKEGGWYRLRARTAAGRVLTSDALRYDAGSPNSQALSVARLEGGDTEFCLWGHGEEMPLAAIRAPFPGDHWWYPDRTFWRIRARFGERVETLEGGGNRAAATGFRGRGRE
jgi:hypothetical protein